MEFNLWLIFLTGLGVGGITCMAVQGGLLASLIALRENQLTQDIKKHAVYSTIYFLVGKTFSHIILGFILGFFGGAININDNVQGIMQLLAGLYMILIAFNLLNIHPIFRYVVIQPPKFLVKLIKNQSKSKDIFAPFILGLMTILIPCGTTLAMETLAISRANAIEGALIMGVFTVGTIPAFLTLGAVFSILGDKFKANFLKIVAIIIVYLGMTSILGSFNVINFSSFNVVEDKKYGMDLIPSEQIIEIKATSYGYEPSYIKVKKDFPVTIKLIGENNYSCASAFRIPSLNIKYNLAPTDSKTFTFIPKEKGQIQFTCSMGVFTGIIEVI